MSVLTAACIFSSCRNEIDEYYARPDWLESPIYIRLQEKGNFTSYLAVVDKAGYRDILSKAGFYTVFAPTDEAFQKYFQDESITSAGDIDSLTAQKIVSYSIAYNSYDEERLDDYQSTDELGWVPDKAFKRTTANYKWVYDDQDIDGNKIKVVDQNGVRLLPEDGPVTNLDDNNNKHIPYFTDPFMTSEGITSDDYNYFFPDNDYSGFNVMGAQVTEADISCENGYVHAVDRVILPPPNLDELLSANPDYSMFRDMIDRYIREFDLAPTDFLNRYEEASGQRADVYIKNYPGLVFAPACENYMKYGGGEDYDAQTDGWTLFAPTNEAVQAFFDSKFLTHYGSLDNMSTQIIAEFINAHMFRTMVWPSKFATITSYFGEPPRFDMDENITEKQFASNGLFYGTNKVQATDAFFTALGPIILDPDYALMLQALNTSELFYIVKNTGIKLTVFMINNAAFDSLGLSYNGASGAWDLDNPELGTNANVAVNRLINLHVVLGEQQSLASDAIVETYGGEYIRHNGGFVWAAGNIEYGDPLKPPKNKAQASNGLNYTIDVPLRFSVDNIGKQLQASSRFTKFYSYLAKSAESLPGYVYDPSSHAITNLKNTDNNTLLVPSNAAMDSAVAHGVLPAIGFADFTQAQQDKLLKFVLYHVLSKVIVTNDGQISGDVKTLYSTVDGPTYLTVFNDGVNFGAVDHRGRTANVVIPSSNVLGNRAVIHQIDNYLIY